ncbi:hypothetical protein, partial [Candidatus Binatus sp.]
MKLDKVKFALLVCALTIASLFAANTYAQQGVPVAPGDAVTSDQSLTIENDKVRTSAEHHYNSPAERAQDDLLITEVKSALLDKGISNGYPVEV